MFQYPNRLNKRNITSWAPCAQSTYFFPIVYGDEITNGRKKFNFNEDYKDIRETECIENIAMQYVTPFEYKTNHMIDRIDREMAEVPLERRLRNPPTAISGLTVKAVDGGIQNPVQESNNGLPRNTLSVNFKGFKPTENGSSINNESNTVGRRGGGGGGNGPQPPRSQPPGRPDRGYQPPSTSTNIDSKPKDSYPSPEPEGGNTLMDEMKSKFKGGKFDFGSKKSRGKINEVKDNRDIREKLFDEMKNKKLNPVNKVDSSMIFETTGEEIKPIRLDTNKDSRKYQKEPSPKDIQMKEPSPTSLPSTSNTIRLPDGRTLPIITKNLDEVLAGKMDEDLYPLSPAPGYDEIKHVPRYDENGQPVGYGAPSPDHESLPGYVSPTYEMATPSGSTFTETKPTETLGNQQITIRDQKNKVIAGRRPSSSNSSSNRVITTTLQNSVVPSEKVSPTSVMSWSPTEAYRGNRQIDYPMNDLDTTMVVTNAEETIIDVRVNNIHSENLFNTVPLTTYDTVNPANPNVVLGQMQIDAMRNDKPISVQRLENKNKRIGLLKKPDFDVNADEEEEEEIEKKPKRKRRINYPKYKPIANSANSVPDTEFGKKVNFRKPIVVEKRKFVYDKAYARSLPTPYYIQDIHKLGYKALRTLVEKYQYKPDISDDIQKINKYTIVDLKSMLISGLGLKKKKIKGKEKQK